ncbi:hypothetical protein [Stutzerimonas nitrititolerans]|nr:hypothetical protein [Stutzerimonas nitrititolerans]
MASGAATASAPEAAHAPAYGEINQAQSRLANDGSADAAPNVMPV